MKKKKRTHPQKRTTKKNLKASSRFPPMNDTKPGDLTGRVYPPLLERQKIIQLISSKPEENRSSSEIWTLGVFALYEGILDDDEFQINEGVGLLTKASQHSEPIAAAPHDLGWILLVRGLDSLALPYLEQASKLDPNDRDICTLLAWAYIGLGQKDNAASCLKKSITLEGSIQADHELLKSLESGDDLKVLRSNLVLNNTNILTIAKDDTRSIETLKIMRFTLKQVLKSNPSNIVAKYGLALSHYKLNEYSLSEPILKDIIDSSPNHADALTTLALINKKTDRLNEAIALYRKAVLADKFHVLANVNLAAYVQDEQEFAEAREYLENALKGDKEDESYPLALDLYANNIAQLDEDYEREKKYHLKAINADPKNPLFKLNYITSLICLGDIYNLKQAWSKYQQDISFISSKTFNDRTYEKNSKSGYELIKGFVKVIKNCGNDPIEWITTADLIRRAFGFKAAKNYLNKSWELRNKILKDDRKKFYSSIAVFAANTAVHELALEINQEAEKLNLGHEFTSNVAVELSNLGRHNEAIKKALSMSMDLGRSYTVLGNIYNNAGRKKKALENYLQALEKDSKFLLPFENGILAAISQGDTESLLTFFKKLETDWKNNPKATALKGLILFHRGLPNEAARELEKILIEDEKFVFPELDQVNPNHPSQEGHEENEEDLSIFKTQNDDNATYQYHYLLGRSYLLSKNYTPLLGLLQWARDENKCQDGNWTVMGAEFLRQQNNIDEALKTVLDMTPQPPPLITASFCNLTQGNHEEAFKFAKEALSDKFKNNSFYHPMGDPNSLAHGIIAEVLFAKEEYANSLKEAQVALDLDPCNFLAYRIMINTLIKLDRPNDGNLVAIKGLSCCPGEPALTEYLIARSLKAEKFEDAEELLDHQREYLKSRGESAHAAYLGEKIAKQRNSDKSPEQIIISEIKNGESVKCEFKSTLRYNIKAKNNDKAMTHACLKSMAGFLNTEGGTLYIGVSDDGEVLGLKHDNYKNSDQFMNILFNFIDQALGKQAATLIKAQIFEINGKQVCQILCKASPRPVFMKWGNSEEAFVRAGPSTRSMPMSEFVAYIKSHFEKEQIRNLE